MNNHHEIVKRLIDTKAVDFAAIGKFVSENGSSIAMLDDPWDRFCGTGKNFLNLYRLRDFGNSPIENIKNLSEIGSEFR